MKNQAGDNRRVIITIFTMGSNRKAAERFFMLLTSNRVRRVIDVRLKNNSPLLGFTRQDHLPYLLQTIAGIEYEHRPELAPDDGIRDLWKAKAITWWHYEERFMPLLQERRIEHLFEPSHFDRACLLCSEPTADQCHRRLVAEYLRDRWADRVRPEIVHL